MKPTITLLTNIVQRLELKGKKFEVFSGATEEDIQNLWEVLQTIDSTLTHKETTKKAIKGKEDLEAFLSHCCVARHYSFSIKKCGEDNCSICKSIRMPKDVFQMLRHLPDPMMGNDDHYLSFEDVYNTKTSEKDRPSLSNAKKVKILPFVPTSRHVQNVKVVVQCEECNLWRLLYSKGKLTLLERQLLQTLLEDVSYSCGATFQDLDLPDSITCVHILEHNCYDSVEPLYYVAGFDPICVYCASEEVQDSSTSEKYPMCVSCEDKEPIKRK